MLKAIKSGIALYQNIPQRGFETAFSINHISQLRDSQIPTEWNQRGFPKAQAIQGKGRKFTFKEFGGDNM